MRVMSRSLRGGAVWFEEAVDVAKRFMFGGDLRIGMISREIGVNVSRKVMRLVWEVDDDVLLALDTQ